MVKGADGYLQKVEQGEPGLLIGKITESRPFIGYTEKEKTEKAILRDVFEPGDAWFNTGDLLTNIGCAHYQFVDRLGDTFRWKGENVSTTQVENILSSHPDVADCVVYGVEIEGTNGKAGMAAVTPTREFITCCTPIDFKNDHFLLLAVAKISAPFACAISTAAKPTPPAAEWIKILSPG